MNNTLPRPIGNKKDALELAGFALEHMDAFSSYRDDMDVALAVIKECKDHDLLFADKTLLNHKDFVTELCRLDGKYFNSLPDHFKKDKEIILIALRNFGYTYHLIPNEMKYDKDIALTMVLHYGPWLQDVVTPLRDDKDVVLAAVKNNGFSIRYASHRLQEDFDVAISAVKNNPDVFEYLEPIHQGNKRIFLATLESGGYAERLVSYTSEDLFQFLSKTPVENYITKLKSSIEREKLLSKFQDIDSKIKQPTL